MDEKKNIIIESWQGFMKLCSGRQQAYCKSKLDNAFVCHCVSIKDVFTADEIKLIKRVIKPEQKMCFKNAHLLTTLFPNRVKYVEGEVTILNGGMGIEHAWNLVDDEHYVDVTFELALDADVTQEGYVALGVYDAKMLRRITNKTGYYGGIYNQLYLEGLSKKAKLNK